MTELSEQEAASIPLVAREYDCVADTMAVVLHLEKRRMPAVAKAWFIAAERGEKKLGISTITLAEIGYLAQNGRISLTPAHVMFYAYHYRSVIVVSLTGEMVVAAFATSDIPELHDRLISGTSYLKGFTQYARVPILTNDPIIAASAFVDTEWE